MSNLCIMSVMNINMEFKRLATKRDALKIIEIFSVKKMI
jgi:hypothetical protein